MCLLWLREQVLDSWKQTHFPRLGTGWEEQGSQVPPKQPCPGWGIWESLKGLGAYSKLFYIIFPQVIATSQAVCLTLRPSGKQPHIVHGLSVRQLLLHCIAYH